MTQSITSAESTSADIRAEKALIGVLGYALYLTFQLSIIFGPPLKLTVVATAEVFCFMRFVALMGTVLFFTVFRFAVKDPERLVRSASYRIVAYVLQIALPLIVILEYWLPIQTPVLVAIAFWALWGIGFGMLSCSWMDMRSNLNESTATRTAYWSFAVASCITTGILALPKPIMTVGLILIATVSLGCLFKTPQAATSSSNETDLAWLKSQHIFRRSGSYVLFIDGILITLTASILIFGKYEMTTGSPAAPIFIVGLAMMFTAVLFYLLRKFNPSLLSLRQSQLLFLPVIVGGLIVVAYYTGLPSLIAAFALFSILYVFDFTNLSVLLLKGNLLGISASYVFARGRVYIILGEAIGWLLGAFFFTPEGALFLPPIMTAITVLICAYIMLGAVAPDRYPLFDPVEPMQSAPDPEVDPEAATSSFVDEPSSRVPYRERCVHAAQQFDLTPREGEILVFLAKGRNAKHIADQLFVTERTVKTHIYHIYQKMCIHSQQELINIVEEIED